MPPRSNPFRLTPHIAWPTALSCHTDALREPTCFITIQQLTSHSHEREHPVLVTIASSYESVVESS